MKALVVFLLSAALLLTSVAAFASIENRPIQTERNISHWIGKPVSQILELLGQPTTTSRGGGRLIYDYVVAPQHVGPIETYQFAVGPNGKVDTAKVIF